MTASAEPPLAQFWWLHDARWYQGVLKRFGPDAANEINEEAAKFVARRVARWCAGRYGIRFRGQSLEDFLKEFSRIPSVMFPDDGHMRVKYTVLDPSTWETAVSDVFPKRMLRAAGTQDGYRCPCMGIRSGFFEGVGLACRDERLECELDGGQVCRFRTSLTPRGDTRGAETAPAHGTAP
ncbi:hypothetical protein GCM10010211_32860 [Streptomyces albospinus]|uniref:4-vinyl reductase 4VR domain-containing protein n=1 Tax=Streptomyces albospinus TaxID=285515 RepID=A0ABQ2V3B5_9ACTN|nr:hypothetical protein [Streptomyces albospinus]GGU65175.1 hypothetical protein GCM10010211_32860 [Streptomyces albospinus]